jgi:hypothetical protein
MDPNNLISLIFGGGALMTFFIVGITCVATLGSFAFVGVILWFTLRPLLQNMNQRSQILQTGIPAMATIVGLADTGMLVNYQPQVRIALQVQPPNGAPYQTEVTMVVSQLMIPRVQPGMQVPVKIDPKDPSKVAIAM